VGHASSRAEEGARSGAGCCHDAGGQTHERVRREWSKGAATRIGDGIPDRRAPASGEREREAIS
jgi:hypothetical protein